jgi:hypothetical protein
MAREIWLRRNRRVAAILAVCCTLALAMALFVTAISSSGVMRALSGGAAGISLVALVAIGVRSRQPRLTYCDGGLEVHLTGGRPVRVPIDVVECFFLGQGPSWLPRMLFGSRLETATLIVRLAESAVEWRHREDIHPRLGHWCEGYITIRGTCCEPLSGELVASLNRRLVEVHRLARHSQRLESERAGQEA